MAQCLNQSELAEAIEKLNSGKSNDWQIIADRLSKEYKFTSFQAAFSFMTECASAAERLDHHPDWCNSYNIVSVQLITHSAGCITRQDIELASIMDKKEGGAK